MCENVRVRIDGGITEEEAAAMHAWRRAVTIIFKSAERDLGFRVKFSIL